MQKLSFYHNALKAASRRTGKEIASLLGQDFSVTDFSGRLCTDEEAVAEFGETSKVFTEFIISGDLSGTAYVIVDTADAIVLGGGLILMPDDAVKDLKNKMQFDGDVADAFGEIANIVSGSYTSVFEESFSRKIHFKKTRSFVLDPLMHGAKIGELFPEGDYYFTQSDISHEGDAMEPMLFLVPVEALGLETRAKPSAEPAPPQPTPKSPTDKAASGASSATPPKTPSGGIAAPTILIISDDESLAEPFVSSLDSQGHSRLSLTSRQNLKESINSLKVTGAFLILSEMGDRSLSSIIKTKSVLPAAAPLVVAGSQWTRTAVLQAIKYGACDILATPVTTEEILQRVSSHKMAKG